jgi:hypothetical protein
VGSPSADSRCGVSSWAMGKGSAAGRARARRGAHIPQWSPSRTASGTAVMRLRNPQREAIIEVAATALVRCVCREIT